MIEPSLALITVGFTLGLVHALDADHVMAVSAMANSRPGFWRSLRYCANWALGHGGVLLVCGALLFGFGLGVPPTLAWAAELSVGVFLVVLGALCLWRFRRARIRMIEHRHGDVVHRHWEVEGSDHAGNRRARHTPVMVGMLHGLAGSAPALALVPVVVHGDSLGALGYLLLFSLGVMLAMLAFGLGFGALQRYLHERYLWLFDAMQRTVAGAAMVVGGYWIAQAL